MMKKALTILTGFLTFFVRARKPKEDYKEAKSIYTEGKIYLIIYAVLLFVLMVSSSFVTSESGVTAMIIVGAILMLLVVYYGFKVPKLSKIATRAKNLTCDNCSAKLVLDENTTYEVLGRKWSENSSSNSASATRYTEFFITCKCPSCGEEKDFRVEIASANVHATAYGSSAKSRTEEELIADYFNGKIFG